MSQAPFYSNDARWGAKYGNRSLVDGIVRDGLQDPYDGSMMGVCGDLCADEQGLDRSAQNEYAIASYKRAQKHRIMDGLIRKLRLLRFLSEKATR